MINFQSSSGSVEGTRIYKCECFEEILLGDPAPALGAQLGCLLRALAETRLPGRAKVENEMS